MRKKRWEILTKDGFSALRKEGKSALVRTGGTGNIDISWLLGRVENI